MPNLVRRIVSGPKARFVDPTLGVDLDLVYLTDSLILMGFPASGITSLYRNRRSSVRKFLYARHGRDNVRVYNLCPRGENEYPKEEFEGNVSRFPFPDHHVPPLSMIPLFVADLTSWLTEEKARGESTRERRRRRRRRRERQQRDVAASKVPFEARDEKTAASTDAAVQPSESAAADPISTPSSSESDPDSADERQDHHVGVIHCKAGKGRTGTMAICYLLTLQEFPQPPIDPRNHSGAVVLPAKAAAVNGTGRDGVKKEEEVGSASASASASASPTTSPATTHSSTLAVPGTKPSAGPGASPAWLSNDQHGRRSLSNSFLLAPLPASAAMGGAGSVSSSGSMRTVSSVASAAPQLQTQTFGPPVEWDRRGSAANQSTSGSSGSGLGACSAREDEAENTQESAPPPAATGPDDFLAQEEQVAERLRAVFEMHTRQRMKPQRAVEEGLEAKGTTNKPRRMTSFKELRRKASFLTSIGGKTIVAPERSQGIPLDQESDTEEEEIASAPRTAERGLAKWKKRIVSSMSLRADAAAAAAAESQPPASSAAVSTPTRPTTRTKRSKSFSTSIPPVPALPCVARMAVLGTSPMGRSSDAVDYLSGARRTASSASYSTRTDDANQTAGTLMVQDESEGIPPPPILNASGQVRPHNRTRSSSLLSFQSASGSAAGHHSRLTSSSSLRLSHARSQLYSQGDRDQQQATNRQKSKPVKYGVSIASQRRWIGYWARILALQDPRAVLRSHMPRGRRQVVITRIMVDRVVQLKAGTTFGEEEQEGGQEVTSDKFFKSLPHSDSLAIHVGRYDDGLVKRLETWERSARRRHVAFGSHDPGGSSYDLGLRSDDDEDDIGANRRGESEAERAKRIRALRDKSSWGIGVDAEAEVARSFDWGKDKDETRIDTFAVLHETSRARLKPDDFPSTMSEKTRQALVMQENGKEGKRKALVRYTFVPPGRYSEVNVPERGSSIRGPSPTPAALAAQGNGSSSASATAPPASEAYAPKAGSRVRGLPVDADRELHLKVLLGRSGKTHALLPDFAAAGWCWFIPSFEDPEGRDPPKLQGHQARTTTVVRFEREELDFCKTAMGVVGLQVEWSWTDVAAEEE